MAHFAAFAAASIIAAWSGTEAGAATCTPIPDCVEADDCAEGTVAIQADQSDVVLEGADFGRIEGMRLREGQPMDRIRAADTDWEIRATEDSIAFFSAGLTGRLVQGAGSQVVLTLQVMPRRYLEYPGSFTTWRGECEGLF